MFVMYKKYNVNTFEYFTATLPSVDLSNSAALFDGTDFYLTYSGTTFNSISFSNTQAFLISSKNEYCDSITFSSVSTLTSSDFSNLSLATSPSSNNFLTSATVAQWSDISFFEIDVSLSTASNSNKCENTIVYTTGCLSLPNRVQG